MSFNSAASIFVLCTTCAFSFNAMAALYTPSNGSPETNINPETVAPASTTPPPPVPPEKKVKVAKPKPNLVNIGVPPVYGRSSVEYFYTPIVGINYTDVTQLSSSFLVPEQRWLASDAHVPVNNTSLGAAVGVLIDGQYQITATDYWRGGFQTGLIYTSEAESDFKAEVCLDAACSNTSTNYVEKGSFASSSFIMPVFFSFSHYAKSDEYIVSLKLGANVAFQRYALNFEGFDLSPTREFQVSLGFGIDGRFRVPQSDQFILLGFMTGNPFVETSGTFSGVEALDAFLVYIGYSFS